MAVLNDLMRLAQRVLSRSARQALRSEPGKPRSRNSAGLKVSGSGRTVTEYPGDYRPRPEIVYEPFDDDLPDPGEVVWTWVPYEEDHSQGKDRPVLVIGRDGPWLLALQVTSQDHDRDAAQEAAVGRYWIDIGTGAWDNKGRPSEVRVNRIIRIDPAQVRRIGAVLRQNRFDAVAREVLRHY